jgi:hypothetical protein
MRCWAVLHGVIQELGFPAGAKILASGRRVAGSGIIEREEEPPICTLQPFAGCRAEDVQMESSVPSAGTCRLPVAPALRANQLDVACDCSGQRRQVLGSEVLMSAAITSDRPAASGNSPAASSPTGHLESDYARTSKTLWINRLVRRAPQSANCGDLASRLHVIPSRSRQRRMPMRFVILPNRGR